MVLFQVNIDKNPRREICRLYKFLGVNENFIPPEISRKIGVGILPGYEFLEKFRIRLFYFFQANAPQFIDIVRNSGFADSYRKFNEKHKEDVLIEDAVRERLMEYYKPEIFILRCLLSNDDDSLCPDWLAKS
jgi:hypothetical protein